MSDSKDEIPKEFYFEKGKDIDKYYLLEVSGTNCGDFDIINIYYNIDFDFDDSSLDELVKDKWLCIGIENNKDYNFKTDCMENKKDNFFLLYKKDKDNNKFIYAYKNDYKVIKDYTNSDNQQININSVENFCDYINFLNKQKKDFEDKIFVEFNKALSTVNIIKIIQDLEIQTVKEKQAKEEAEKKAAEEAEKKAAEEQARLAREAEEKAAEEKAAAELKATEERIAAEKLKAEIYAITESSKEFAEKIDAQAKEIAKIYEKILNYKNMNDIKIGVLKYDNEKKNEIIFLHNELIKIQKTIESANNKAQADNDEVQAANGKAQLDETLESVQEKLKIVKQKNTKMEILKQEVLNHQESAEAEKTKIDDLFGEIELSEQQKKQLLAKEVALKIKNAETLLKTVIDYGAEENYENLSKLKEESEKYKTYLESEKEKLEELSKNPDLTEEQQESINSAISQIEAAIVGTQTKIKEIESKIKAKDDEGENLKAGFETAKTELENIKNSINQEIGKDDAATVDTINNLKEKLTTKDELLKRLLQEYQARKNEFNENLKKNFIYEHDEIAELLKKLDEKLNKIGEMQNNIAELGQEKKFESRKNQPRKVLNTFLSKGKDIQKGGSETLLNTSEITFEKQIDNIIDNNGSDKKIYKEFYTNIKTYYKELNNIDLINGKIDKLEEKVTNITYTRAEEQVNINIFEKYFYLTELIDFLEILVLYKQFEQIKNKLISSDVIYKLNSIDYKEIYKFIKGKNSSFSFQNGTAKEARTIAYKMYFYLVLSLMYVCPLKNYFFKEIEMEPKNISNPFKNNKDYDFEGYDPTITDFNIDNNIKIKLPELIVIIEKFIDSFSINEINFEDAGIKINIYKFLKDLNDNKPNINRNNGAEIKLHNFGDLAPRSSNFLHYINYGDTITKYTEYLSDIFRKLDIDNINDAYIDTKLYDTKDNVDKFLREELKKNVNDSLLSYIKITDININNDVIKCVDKTKSGGKDSILDTGNSRFFLKINSQTTDSLSLRFIDSPDPFYQKISAQEIASITEKKDVLKEKFLKTISSSQKEKKAAGEKFDQNFNKLIGELYKYKDGYKDGKLIMDVASSSNYIKPFIDNINFAELSNQLNQNNKFILGNFTRIFNASYNNKTIVNEIDELKNNLFTKPIFVWGYGASGSGKTSALIYFNKGDAEQKDGIIINLLKDPSVKAKVRSVSVNIYEMYDHTSSNTTGDSKNHIKPVFEKDIVFGLDNGTFKGELKDYIIRHKYRNYREHIVPRLTTATTATTETTKMNETLTNTFVKLPQDNKDDQKYELGQFLTEMIDGDRYIKATTNNPVSSRSHVILCLKITNANQGEKGELKENYIFVADFAGIENKFDKEDLSMVLKFLNLRRDSEPRSEQDYVPYYSDEYFVREGGDRNDPDNIILDEVISYTYSNLKKDCNVIVFENIKFNDLFGIPLKIDDKYFDKKIYENEHATEKGYNDYFKVQINDLKFGDPIRTTTKYYLEKVKTFLDTIQSEKKLFEEELVLDLANGDIKESASDSSGNYDDFFKNHEDLFKNIIEEEGKAYKAAIIANSNDKSFEDIKNRIIDRRNIEYISKYITLSKKKLIEISFFDSNDIIDILTTDQTLLKSLRDKTKIDDFTKRFGLFVVKAPTDLERLSEFVNMNLYEKIKSKESDIRILRDGIKNIITNLNNMNLVIPAEVIKEEDERFNKMKELKQIFLIKKKEIETENAATRERGKISKQISELEKKTPQSKNWEFFISLAKDSNKKEHAVIDLNEIKNNKYKVFNDYPGYLDDLYKYYAILYIKIFYGKKICEWRTKEGTFINKTIEETRDAMIKIINYKNKDKAFLCPDYISACSPAYCGTDKDIIYKCFRKSTAEQLSDIDDFKTDESVLFNYLYNVRKIGREGEGEGEGEGKENIGKFYEDLRLCIFCMFNISKHTNNPPVIPYLNINSLKRKVELFKRKYGEYINYDEITTDRGEYQNYIEKNETKLKTIYTNIKADLKKDFEKLKELAFNTYAGKSNFNKERFEKIVIDVSQTDIPGLDTNGDKTSIYTVLIEPLENLLNEIDIQNQSTSIGTLEFMDRITKYNLNDINCDVAEQIDAEINYIETNTGETQKSESVNPYVNMYRLIQNSNDYQKKTGGKKSGGKKTRSKLPKKYRKRTYKKN